MADAVLKNTTHDSVSGGDVVSSTSNVLKSEIGDEALSSVINGVDLKISTSHCDDAFDSDESDDYRQTWKDFDRYTQKIFRVSTAAASLNDLVSLLEMPRH